MADSRKVIDRFTPQMLEAWERAIADIRDKAEIEKIVAALRNGDIEEALKALHLSQEVFEEMNEVFRQAYIAGGRDALIGLPAIPDPFPHRTSLSGSRRATLGLRPSCGRKQVSSSLKLPVTSSPAHAGI